MRGDKEKKRMSLLIRDNNYCTWRIVNIILYGDTCAMKGMVNEQDKENRKREKEREMRNVKEVAR